MSQKSSQNAPRSLKNPLKILPKDTQMDFHGPPWTLPWRPWANLGYFFDEKRVPEFSKVFWQMFDGCLAPFERPDLEFSMVFIDRDACPTIFIEVRFGRHLATLFAPQMLPNAFCCKKRHLKLLEFLLSILGAELQRCACKTCVSAGIINN